MAALAIVSSICEALSLSDMWRYVCNSMECHSHCCNDFMMCDCETNEIEVDKEKGLLDLCILIAKPSDGDSDGDSFYSRDDI